MATTNRDRVGMMLELLQSGLTPFVQREMEAAYKSQWLTQASYNLRDLDTNNPHFDAHTLLVLMWEHWNEVFRNTLGHAERSLVSELRMVRNDWAHQKPISGDDAYRALDSAARLLTAISAPEAREVERQKQELLRIRFEEQARRERRKAAVTPLEGQPSGGLRPWRELVTPHSDVASGRYQQAEFAADLDAVHYNDATTGNEYRDPEEFFKRTYLTDGLHKLLRNVLTRLGGQGGDPVVELKTNFGGGKPTPCSPFTISFQGSMRQNWSAWKHCWMSRISSAFPKLDGWCWWARRSPLANPTQSQTARWCAPSGVNWHGSWGRPTRARRRMRWWPKVTPKAPAPARKCWRSS